ncbi:hypothetical protein MC885_011924 [Smutsia gigantea]|nr:hypothetical protein MC885_011924 [Smutsia gigantea]
MANGLPGQCQCLGLPVADYFKQWINLKKVLCLSPLGASSGSPVPRKIVVISGSGELPVDQAAGWSMTLLYLMSPRCAKNAN